MPDRPLFRAGVCSSRPCRLGDGKSPGRRIDRGRIMSIAHSVCPRRPVTRSAAYVPGSRPGTRWRGSTPGKALLLAAEPCYTRSPASAEGADRVRGRGTTPTSGSDSPGNDGRFDLRARGGRDGVWTPDGKHVRSAGSRRRRRASTGTGDAVRGRASLFERHHPHVSSCHYGGTSSSRIRPGHRGHWVFLRG